MINDRSEVSVYYSIEPSEEFLNSVQDRIRDCSRAGEFEALVAQILSLDESSPERPMIGHILEAETRIQLSAEVDKSSQ
jgi:hypothetical protein